MPDTTTGVQPLWRKATASTGNGQCVELAIIPAGIAVRDSKDPQGPMLHFTREELAAFLHGAKAGEFDDMARQTS
jgi:hypothetical protein